ncbi:hypothetical protein SAMN02745244_03084 [Tessaracoccus bendigoensis DSM 12906]|uniref:Uncharacterized protein n=2 Tax=Tessaracoccus TaxID=72763 RepID=A0A1M6LIX2_9ACTN|nr:hypothetical protein SAMN02745244_03084 [Tessaracoccus bendigoensis DSM 12906]
MTSSKPHDAHPADMSGRNLVAELMDGLVGVEELPVEEQTARLAQVQRTLAGILSDDPLLTRVSKPGFPG